MKGRDGPLNVIQRIAAHYYIFGIHLLQDDNGEKVDLIMSNHIHEGAEDVTRAILKEWLRDRPEHTRTYGHLIKCLRESELGALADDIAERITRGGKPVHSTCTHDTCTYIIIMVIHLLVSCTHSVCVCVYTQEPIRERVRNLSSTCT